VTHRAYKIGLRLAQLPYVRHAIDDRANLDEFKKRPGWQVPVGCLLIALSFAMCWPVITALGGVSIYFKQPLIVVIGGPAIYLSSHLVFIAGMALSGEKYTRIFFRWLTRVGVERLLAFAPARS
jgi:hypothetical protein